jgi:nitric oxide reductase NorE protein
MDELLRGAPSVANAESTGGDFRPAPQVPSLPGDVGFWTFIAADATLFALLFLQFSLDRSSHVALFSAGQGALLVPLATVNTVVLATSSWQLALALRSAHRGDIRSTARLMSGTITLGVVFGVLKVAEYQIEVNSGHTLSSNSFFMYYFVITGVHLLHLIVGVAALAVIRLRVCRDTNGARNRTILECGTCYWHLIDLLWMFIFPLLYLAR